MERIEKIYSRSKSILGQESWERLVQEAARQGELDPDRFPEAAGSVAEEFRFPPFLPDLVRLEREYEKAANTALPPTEEIAESVINPSLSLLRVSWKNLSDLFKMDRNRTLESFPAGEEWIMLWLRPAQGGVVVEKASAGDLLALKLVAEEWDFGSAAAEANVSTGVLETAVQEARRKGLLLSPASRIRRDPKSFCVPPTMNEEVLTASVFTLQWHITQACDLHCKHCYDRSDRERMGLDEAIRVLDDFKDFCRRHNVAGQVSFTGGNPLLHPDFETLYRAAAERGLGIAILGNPTSKERIKKLADIARPVFYQVSLEGLPEHNDSIRGSGHFGRTMDFLSVLKEAGIWASVMLTLTRENMAQVLPLAEVLRGKADGFTFNRISLVGEGANLKLPDPGAFHGFLKDYLEAARSNPVLGLKENLLNAVCLDKGRDLFGGCTGYGCGAAFNFVSVLPDGEVHACRKFPSPLGNMLELGLEAVYTSESAARYRTRPSACRSCEIRTVCGGCLAVSHSHGLDVFQDRDPFCFMG